MKLILLRASFLVFFALITISISGQEEGGYNCFSIAVGKEASVDGSVMLAHNEDDSGERVVNWYKVPHNKHDPLTDSISLKNGYKIAQSKETYAYLWLELPELEFSDSYMNEYGVTIASDACKSREDNPELVQGGIGYWLRRLLIERSISAKEAVRLAGQLIEKIGYSSSGRTYAISDPYETWMLAVVKGKHWVAQRVPENQVAIIPNYYTITRVNLNDKHNFMGSPDLIDYAIKRGWYNPEIDGDFNFRKAYSDPENLTSIVNRARHWVSINALSKKQYSLDEELPFSFIPKEKLSLQDLFKVLRNHYEGTEFDLTDSYKLGNPHHQKTMSVCSNSNQYGFVVQLRDWMSVEIGAVLWYSPIRPCVEPFVPIYNGMNKIPENFASTNYNEALRTHFDGVQDFNRFPFHNHISFYKKAKIININYGKYIVEQRKYIDKFEKGLLNDQDKFENKMQNLLLENRNEAIKKITAYSTKKLEYIVEKANE